MPDPSRGLTGSNTAGSGKESVRAGEKNGSLLLVDGVTKLFERSGMSAVRGTSVRALDNASLALGEKPEVTALVGESGSGKTTLVRLLFGLEAPTSGRLLYKGREVSEWLRRSRREYLREVQIIFQDPYGTYNPFYRVDRVLYNAIRKFKVPVPPEGERALIEASLESVGLRPSELLGRYPHQLSGGERQRIMLARIYLIKPKLVIADEPVSMLDASLRAMFLEQLKQFKSLGISCLYITHDLNIAYHIADRIVILCQGKVIERGATETVVKAPLHPYTQQLITSVPTPDPTRRWKGQVTIETVGLHELRRRPSAGCIYAQRCSYVMDRCRTNVPPFYESDGRDVACFLHDPSRSQSTGVSSGTRP